MLKQSRPQRAWVSGLHGQADIGRHVGCQFSNGDADVRPDWLALTQPVQQIIAAHAQFTLPGRAIDPFYGRDLADKQGNRLVASLNQEPNAGRQPRRDIHKFERIGSSHKVGSDKRCCTRTSASPR